MTALTPWPHDIDYPDIDGKVWRPLTVFQGIIGRKVSFSNSTILNILKVRSLIAKIDILVNDYANCELCN